MTPELRSRFTVVDGYWVQCKDVADVQPNGVRLHNGTFIKGAAS